MKRRMNAECVTYLEMDAMRKFNLVQTISVTFLSLSKASSFAKKIFQAIFLFRNFKNTFLWCLRPECLLRGPDSFIMQSGSISQQSLDSQTYFLWICSLTSFCNIGLNNQFKDRRLSDIFSLDLQFAISTAPDPTHHRLAIWCKTISWNAGEWSIL